VVPAADRPRADNRNIHASPPPVRW
jgi:hypothetical protein